METIDSVSGMRPRRDTKYIDLRADFLIFLLLRSRDMIDMYHAAKENIDPKQVHSQYTQRLLVLQEHLNNIQHGLGSGVATGINERLEQLDYFTALGIIQYLLDHSEIMNPKEISEVPEIIEGIKGKNGADSRILRYHFVNKWLPRVNHDMNLARLAKTFVRKYADKATSENEDIEHVRQKIQEWYGGDFNEVKKMLTDTLRRDLEGTLRKLTLVENAEPAEKPSDSYK